MLHLVAVPCLAPCLSGVAHAVVYLQLGEWVDTGKAVDALMK